MVKFVRSKGEALSSNPSTPSQKNKKIKREAVTMLCLPAFTIPLLTGLGTTSPSVFSELNLSKVLKIGMNIKRNCR